ncbi:MAG: immunoglobulin-like domain-containing protein [Ignavibacteriales bacterium]
MKKGFTLIELLGVISILALIALIALPSIEKSIKKGQQDLYDIQIENIKAALRDYRTDNLLQMPKNNNDTLTMTLAQLKAAGKIDFKITDPKTEQLFPDDMLLHIKKVGKIFEYTVDLTSGTSRGVFNNPEAPTIALKGDVLVYVTDGTTYIDKGVEAKTASGDPITGISVSISGSGSSIDPSTSGNYLITYKVTDNGITAMVVRTVIVIQPI